MENSIPETNAFRILERCSNNKLKSQGANKPTDTTMTAILEDQTREFQNCNPSKASSSQANFPRETGKQTSENLSQPQAELQGLQGHQSNDSGRPSKRIPERSSKCHFTKQTSPDRRHRVRILERHQAKLSCHNNRPIIPSKESWSTTY